MFEAYIPFFFVALNIWSDGNGMFCDEVLLSIFILVHIVDELCISVFAVVGNVKVYGAARHDHDMATVDFSERCFDGQSGFVEFLLTWIFCGVPLRMLKR